MYRDPTGCWGEYNYTIDEPSEELIVAQIAMLQRMEEYYSQNNTDAMPAPVDSEIFIINELEYVYREASGEDVCLPENIESITGGAVSTYYVDDWEATTLDNNFNVTVGLTVGLLTAGYGNLISLASGATTSIVSGYRYKGVSIGTYTDYFYRITTEYYIYQYNITIGPKDSYKTNASSTSIGRSMYDTYRQ